MIKQKNLEKHIRHTKLAILLVGLLLALTVAIIIATQPSKTQAHANTPFIHSTATPTRTTDSWLNNVLNRNELSLNTIYRPQQDRVALHMIITNSATPLRRVELFRTFGHIEDWSTILQRFNTGNTELRATLTTTSWEEWLPHDDFSLRSDLSYGKWTYFVFVYEQWSTGSFPSLQPVAIHPQVVHITFGEIIPLPPDPTPPSGHYFAGWYFDQWFTQPYIGQAITGDTELFAKFNPITFIIVYNLNGGSLTGQPTSFTINSALITLPIPTRTNFSFAGWFTSVGFSGSAVTQIPTGTAGNQTFFARWTATEFNITYSLNGGSMTGTIPPTFTVESPIIVLPNPTRAGFTFGGWFGNSSFIGTAIASIPTGSAGHRTLYARWDVITFDIHFNLNGGTMSGQPTSFTIESDMITLPTPTREGFGFRGWYTNAGFSGSAVTNIPAGSIGNRTFFARWDTVLHLVTFFVDGVIFSEIYVPHGTVLGNTHFLVSGTTAVDIFANAEMTNKADLDTPVISNLTLFAVQPFGFYATLQFSVNGRIVRSETHSLNTLLDDVLLVYEMYGFQFMGWYHDSHFTRPVTATDRLTSNTTLYGRFVEVEETGMSTWLIWLIVALAIVGVLTIGGLIFRKRRRR